MIIRKATRADSAIISEHLFLAMADILYEFIGTKSPEKAKKFLHYFVERENNQYSFQNCFVAEIGHEVMGSINIYDGAQLESLRAPIVDYVKSHFGKDFNPEKETQRGEYYIDTFGVSANQQRNGIGTKLLQFAIEKYNNKQQQTLGLLVDNENQKAEKLYLSLGFEFVDRKVLANKNMKHLQRKPYRTIKNSPAKKEDFL